MADPSTSLKHPGHPVAVKVSMEAFISGCPKWWRIETCPDQVKAVGNYLLTLLGPEQYKKFPINGLLPFGPPGVGKTSASLVVLYQWGKASKHARFQDFQEFMVKIRSAWRKDADLTVEDLHADLYKPDILLLDDIGKRSTPEDLETISTIINGRINRGRPTISTTNHDLSTPEGMRGFCNACDSRVLARYQDLDVDVSKRGVDLRIGQGTPKAAP